MITTITRNDIETTVLAAPTPVLLDFYQASCPPCRALEPRLARVAAAYAGTVRVYRVDIDTDLLVAERFKVTSIPTLLLFQHGREVARLDGLIREHDISAAFDRLAAS